MRKTKSLGENKEQIRNKEGDMTASRRTWRARVDGSLALIIATAALGLPLAVSAQQEPKRTLPNNGKAWKVNVVSELLPEKQMLKLQAGIEGDRLVCRSGGSAVFEIPLNAITKMSRDDAKDYPVAGFLMGVATQPSSKQHRFGSKKYREEMAASAVLAGMAIFALLFPRHKEQVHVFWTDKEGEHGAQFLMGRKQGRAMIRKLQQETGVKTRDLGKERKDYKQGGRSYSAGSKNTAERPADRPTSQFLCPGC